MHIRPPSLFAVYLSLVLVAALGQPRPLNGLNTLHSKRGILTQVDYDVPVAVRKMSDDEGQMFFLHYWEYTALDASYDGSNTSQVLPPLLAHSETPWSDSIWGLAVGLFKRDFQCPAGTASCASIGQPDSCCSTDETCITVQDTGLGPVGCCPDGESCGGSVAECDTSQGYSSCPGSSNGGCCIPGYTCSGVGCVLASTTTLHSSSSSSTISPATFTSSVTKTAESVSTYTTTVVLSASTEEPRTVTTTVVVISGVATTSTVSASAPIRPTSDSSRPSTSTIAESTTAAAGATCPTNFYRCSAYYEGGCCRVGRDCSSTSCVATSSILATSDGQATVVVLATSSGNCASGWQSCAASVGGGCCPEGYICGTASCSASAAGESAVSKTVSGGSVLHVPWLTLGGVMAIVIGFMDAWNK